MNADRPDDGRSHVHYSDVIWCSVCGSYADKKAHGMSTVCIGAPQKEGHCGGKWGQLRKLKRRAHPETNERMDERCNPDGSPWGPGMGAYSRLAGDEPPPRRLKASTGMCR